MRQERAKAGTESDEIQNRRNRHLVEQHFSATYGLTPSTLHAEAIDVKTLDNSTVNYGEYDATSHLQGKDMIRIHRGREGDLPFCVFDRGPRNAERGDFECRR